MTKTGASARISEPNIFYFANLRYTFKLYLFTVLSSSVMILSSSVSQKLFKRAFMKCTNHQSAK